MRNTRDGLRPRGPGALPGEPRRADPAGRDHRPLARSAPTSSSTNSYRNYTVADSLSLPARQPHAQGRPARRASSRRTSCRRAPPRAASASRAGGGRTAFQNFLTGNADGPLRRRAAPTPSPSRRSSRSCAGSATRPSCRTRGGSGPGWSLDLRPALRRLPGRRGRERPAQRTSCPRASTPPPPPPGPARTPRRSSPGSGDFANGIVVAGQQLALRPQRPARPSADRLQPRLGFAWDPRNDGRTVVRGGFGVYYDQPLVGIFLQNAARTRPSSRARPSLDPRLSNPGAGSSQHDAAAGVARRDRRATSRLPRTLQYNVGVQRRLLRRAVLDVGYLGSRGDRLIQPVDVNAPLPADVVAAGGVLNLARPYQGYASITTRQTTARSRYDALAVVAALRGGPRGDALGRLHAEPLDGRAATNDRDAIDLPQDRTRLDAEYALARTDRTHVFTANWVYELPLFATTASGLAKAAARRLAALRDRHVLVGAAGLARRHRQHERRAPRHRAWTRSATRSPACPASGPGLRLLVRPGRVRAARRTAPSATPAARSSGCRA